MDQLNYVNMKKIAMDTANSNILIAWREHSPMFSYNQYSTFINNMIIRLSPTAQRLSIGLDLLYAEKSDDFQKIIDAFEHNIDDETGDGSPDKAHANLFKLSSNTYSSAIYKKNIKNTNPLASSLEFHDKSIELFKGNIYTMLGATLAQETHALPQLENMYLGFEKLANKCSNKQWETIKEFYDIHLDGTEERHAKDLNETVWDVLKDDLSTQKFHNGFHQFIAIQNTFWDGLSMNILSDTSYTKAIFS